MIVRESHPAWADYDGEPRTATIVNADDALNVSWIKKRPGAYRAGAYIMRNGWVIAQLLNDSETDLASPMELNVTSLTT